ncbi:hypothetical protein [Corynebacterium sp. A21]|uniref:hypothetical protein n=1 Tax=Corynebacterium sp. A21 TaxID=3457318 RepID=UPI003FD2AD57
MSSTGHFDAQESKDLAHQVFGMPAPNMKELVDKLHQSFPDEVAPPKRDQEEYSGEHVHWAHSNDEPFPKMTLGEWKEANE